MTSAEAAGTGAVQVTISGSTATFHVQLTGFPGSTEFVGAHIHPGAAGVNGPVVVDTRLSASNSPAQITGTSRVFDATVAIDPALAQAIINNPAGFYFNVHSRAHPGGVVRGQLQRVQ